MAHEIICCKVPRPSPLCPECGKSLTQNKWLGQPENKLKAEYERHEADHQRFREFLILTKARHGAQHKVFDAEDTAMHIKGHDLANAIDHAVRNQIIE